MRYVIALGGNALLQRHDRPDAAVQRSHIASAAQALAPIAAEHDVLICHGNGPQIGLLANESGADRELSAPYPLDALGAQTQGLIGYWITQELRNAGLGRPVVALITQTVVDPHDPGFSTPTKFVGPSYPVERVDALTAEHGWTMRADTAGWRRVVASPEPLDVVELDTARRLLDAGTTTVCGGGGGAPVTQTGGRFDGVDAVVDKDLVAAQLAVAVDADRLVLLTDVAQLMRDFGTPDATAIERAHLGDLPSDLPAGSMGPKVEACRRFTSATGRTSSIGALADAAAVVAGRAGTTVLP